MLVTLVTLDGFLREAAFLFCGRCRLVLSRTFVFELFFDEEVNKSALIVLEVKTAEDGLHELVDDCSEGEKGKS